MCVSSLSHLRDRDLRRILILAGSRLTMARPGTTRPLALWGNGGKSARRGTALARCLGAPCVYLEDSFLRSVLPGRAGAPVHGLTFDRQRPFYDSTGPSDLEDMLNTAPLSDTVRGKAIIDALIEADLSKYNTHDPTLPAPAGPYVLVIDQLRGDASIAGAGADAARFTEMLEAARADHPGKQIIVKGHPAATDARPGHFGSAFSDPVSPWTLIRGADAVYTVSSQMGFETILSGKRPQIFGTPFYAGWGLSDDRVPVPRRKRTLDRAQLALAVLGLYPIWYDPSRDRLCTVEEVMAALAARARAWRQDRAGYVAQGMRLWKRASMTAFHGDGPVRYVSGEQEALDLADRSGRPILSWASRTPPAIVDAARQRDMPLLRVEDGFLRSRGLGANLVPPLSLVHDRRGIYYDPTVPSDLEHLIARRAAIGSTARGRVLLHRLRASGLSKYNLDLPGYSPPDAHRRCILVIGQVRDDASVLLGQSGVIPDIEHLLLAARTANPDAHIVYKPHPDVEAGLRDGSIESEQANEIARRVDPVSVLAAAAEVWTLSSLMGFEALLRGKPVVCAGVPFYAGWGLTRDLASADHPAFARRTARPDLAALVEACLIDYPRYHDPVSNLPCPVETVLDRLEQETEAAHKPSLRLLAKLQGLLASQSWIWR
ncbi:putative capsule polysaccharide export protein [Dinoroseobacter shibae DFL 12 = DSM 16493]|uniref:Putative capsule polysaccharide export protein n=2 Tax=Dinoroseobacter shibae TaxID=215813 RepID=A8LR68_DINSH|nr:putative capsule polysaccharide export protein [Dinoroseobacter shibae DFL 12 = DSM 16493]